MEAYYQGFSFQVAYFTNGAILSDSHYIQKEMTIPSFVEIEGETYPVVGIGCCAFRFVGYGGEHIEKITIPDTVKTIENHAFSDCKELNSVVFGNSVEEIKNTAFLGCLRLRKILLPSSLKTIEERAFEYSSLSEIIIDPGNPYLCSVDNVVYSKDMTELICMAPNASMEHLEIPDTVRRIHNYAFRSCNHLKEIVIPNSVVEIGEGAFDGCRCLKELSIPASVLRIGNRAISDSGIEKLLVSEDNPCYCSFENVIYNKEKTILVVAASKGARQIIDIPISVMEISKNAFEYCDYLVEVVIPDSVMKIGKSAFACCANLQKVVLPKHLEKLEDRMFVDDDKLVSVSLPSNLRIIGNNAFNGCENLVDISFPNSLGRVGEEAFCCCRSLAKIELPESLLIIDPEAFSNCAFSKIVIPQSVVRIGYSAFDFNDNLEEVTIPDFVLDLGDYLFMGCENLKRINGEDAKVWLELHD